jgi:methyltransferase (TIGR00027 family)
MAEDRGSVSLTAQRVAAYRLGFERLPAAFGDPRADERLAHDVAGATAFEPSERMTRYLRGRTAFFDQVVLNALERGITQVVTVGAGYDGRALRYGKPGVRWWEVDHLTTQVDKRSRLERLDIAAPHVIFVDRDLRDGGLGEALVRAGTDPDTPSLMMCEGVTVYLDPAVLVALLTDLRSIATEGSRLALSLATSITSEDLAIRDEFQTAVAAMGEPSRNSLDTDTATALFAQTGWRPLDLAERARRAGFAILSPVSDLAKKGANESAP